MCINETCAVGWYVLHLNVADRRRQALRRKFVGPRAYCKPEHVMGSDGCRLAHELAFSWPTVLFERLAQAAQQAR